MIISWKGHQGLPDHDRFKDDLSSPKFNGICIKLNPPVLIVCSLVKSVVPVTLRDLGDKALHQFDWSDTGQTVTNTALQLNQLNKVKTQHKNLCILLSSADERYSSIQFFVYIFTESSGYLTCSVYNRHYNATTTKIKLWELSVFLYM